MDSNSIAIIFFIGVLIMLSAYFSATETAFSSLNKIRLKNMANSGDKKALLVMNLSSDFNKILSTILIGNNIVNIASASLATTLFIKYYGNAGVTLSTVVMTVLVLIFGEISPKSLAKESPEKFAMFSAPILRVFMFVLAPLNFLFTLWRRLLSKFIKSDKSPSITEAELMTLVEEAENEGGINADESELIQSAIEFNDLDVKEIFTPRVEIIAVCKDDSVDEVREAFTEHGFSRLPVYEDSIDNVIGVIHEKDFYKWVNDGKKGLDTIVKKALYVSPNTKISELLRQLQQAKTHVAIVVDEFGGTMGLVTLEDILEELVGEIWDEHDEVIEYFSKVAENKYIISCNADLSDLFEKFDMNCNSADYDANTVSGWVIQELGQIPDVGDSFTYKNLFVTVTKTDQRRVLEISAEVIEEASDTSVE